MSREFQIYESRALWVFPIVKTMLFNSKHIIFTDDDIYLYTNTIEF